MRWYLFTVLSLLTAVVHGQAIYECKQKDGTPAFQDHPCLGAPNAPPMMIAPPNSDMTITSPNRGGSLSQQQAKALIDQFLQARQFNSAMALAKRYGLEGYLSQRDIQGPPQPQRVSSQQLEQLKQALTILQAQVRSLPAKNAPLAATATQRGFKINAYASVSSRGAGSAQNTSVACLDKTELSNKLNPFDLWKSIASCISAERYDEGVFMYAIAGSFGAFDKLRVADESAHEAAQVLPMGTFASLPGDKVAAFKARVQQTLGDASKRGAYCKEIESIGPPDYFPTYMIEYGLGAFPGTNKTQPLVVPFDPHIAWPQAVKQYLRCP